MKDFSELTEQELLALAISLEEEDIRTYADLAQGMRESYTGTARMFSAMSEEEDGHRHRLLDLSTARSSAITSRSSAARTSAASCSARRSGCCGHSASRRCASTRKSRRPSGLERGSPGHPSPVGLAASPALPGPRVSEVSPRRPSSRRFLLDFPARSLSRSRAALCLAEQMGGLDRQSGSVGR